MPTLPGFVTQLNAPPRDLRRRRPKRPATLHWPAHLITVAVLLLVYAAGYSNGRDAPLGRATAPLGPAATQLSPAANHPACHPNLKP